MNVSAGRVRPSVSVSVHSYVDVKADLQSKLLGDSDFQPYWSTDLLMDPFFLRVLNR
jgi:hypothetical protein